MNRIMVCLLCGEQYLLLENLEEHCDDKHDGKITLQIFYEGNKTFTPKPLNSK